MFGIDVNDVEIVKHRLYFMFEKCMRGDSSDNVFSAYPGVRTRGTKNKVGLQEAYEDRSKQGFNWNNLMLQRWTDHNGVEHRVLDDYERNRIMIDLTAQPDDVKVNIFTTIKDAIDNKKDVDQVGTKLLKFCGRWNLQRISDQVTDYSPFVAAKYE